MGGLSTKIIGGMFRLLSNCHLRLIFKLFKLYYEYAMILISNLNNSSQNSQKLREIFAPAKYGEKQNKSVDIFSAKAIIRTNEKNLRSKINKLESLE